MQAPTDAAAAVPAPSPAEQGYGRAMSNTRLAFQPLMAVGLALVVLSCMLLAVRVQGSAMVLVRTAQVLSAIAGAMVLGRAAGWLPRER